MISGMFKIYNENPQSKESLSLGCMELLCPKVTKISVEIGKLYSTPARTAIHTDLVQVT